MKRMVCGQRSLPAFMVDVLAGDDALMSLLLAFRLLTEDTKLSSDESSPVTEYISVSSPELHQEPRFLEELKDVELWPDGPAIGSSSMGTRAGASLEPSLVLDHEP